MIHLKQTCDARRKRKDGTHPIVFRITLNGSTRDISSGFSCTKSNWNYQDNFLKATNKQQEVICNRLEEKELHLIKKIRTFESQHPDCSNIQEVRDYLKNIREIPVTVLEFWNKEIIRLNKSRHYGNARNYSSALNGILLKTSLNIPFEKITYKWLVDLETKLNEDGLKPNSISTYMRKLKSMYNKVELQLKTEQKS